MQIMLTVETKLRESLPDSMFILNISPLLALWSPLSWLRCTHPHVTLSLLSSLFTHLLGRRILKDPKVVAHASHVPLDMTRASLIRVCILPSALPLSPSLILHLSPIPSPSDVRAAPCSSPPAHAALPLLSSSKVDVGNSGLRRDRNSRFSAECRGCSRSCVRACVCTSVTERIPAEPRASEAGLLKDDWRLREDEMQRFLTSMVRRAA